MATINEYNNWMDETARLNPNVPEYKLHTYFINEFGDPQPEKEQQGATADVIDYAQKGAIDVTGSALSGAERLTGLDRGDLGSQYMEQWAGEQDQTISDAGRESVEQWRTLDPDTWTARGFANQMGQGAGSMPLWQDIFGLIFFGL